MADIGALQVKAGNLRFHLITPEIRGHGLTQSTMFDGKCSRSRRGLTSAITGHRDGNDTFVW